MKSSATLSLLCALLLPATAAAQEAAEEAAVIDRILAVVDEDPILQSEVEQVIGLGLLEPEPEEPDELFRARVLQGLIAQGEGHRFCGSSSTLCHILPFVTIFTNCVHDFPFGVLFLPFF